MRVADFVADYLHQQGVAYVYQVIGGMITRLVDAIHQQGQIELISVHHEQAAAFAADAMGRLTGIPGVAMGTSGPGATNLLTGIGSCYFDSVPAVFITGKSIEMNRRVIVPSGSSVFRRPILSRWQNPSRKPRGRSTIQTRRRIFCSKHSSLARSGRPGPVLLDIPMDVQGSEINATLPVTSTAEQLTALSEEVFTDVLRALSVAERPLILVGGGIRSAGAGPLLRQLVDIVHVPVVNSLLAVDALPYHHPLRVGLIGTYGNRWVNLAVGRSDLILVLGSRLDIRQTGAAVSAFQAGRVVYHVDIDEGEINNRLQGLQADRDASAALSH